MEDMYEKFLPIGTVVLLKEAKKRIMVTGYLIKSKSENDTKIFDYIGCLYPEGIFDTEKNLMFNHEDIEKIFCVGYSDDEQKQFHEVLKREFDNLKSDI